MRLIDYDEIRSLFSAQYKETVRLIHNGETHLDNLAEGFTEADRIIRKIPTVDAVEVVRCRDCKHWHEETGWCNEHSHFIGAEGEACHPWESSDWKMLDADDFCSYGERKDK